MEQHSLTNGEEWIRIFSRNKTVFKIIMTLKTNDSGLSSPRLIADQLWTMLGWESGKWWTPASLLRQKVCCRNRYLYIHCNGNNPNIKLEGELGIRCYYYNDVTRRQCRAHVKCRRNCLKKDGSIDCEEDTCSVPHQVHICTETRT